MVRQGPAKPPSLSSNLSATFSLKVKILLYLVSTPIGHLEDISQRALKTLQGSDAILCEDTRRSSILLERYGVRKKLISYYKFKEKEVLEDVLLELQSGKIFSLISDAGTPCINDPGLILVQACIERKIPFTAIPGPCSLIEALVLSGMDTEKFQFIGFLPRKGEKELRQTLSYSGTTIAFESPERLTKTLKALHNLDPERNIAIAREMTKTFEECRRGKAEELLTHYLSHPPKGEVVILIAGGALPSNKMPIEELVEMLQELHGLSLKEAVKMAAKLSNTPKRSVYRNIHENR